MNTERTKCYIVDKYSMKHLLVYNMANAKLISYEDGQPKVFASVILRK